MYVVVPAPSVIVSAPEDQTVSHSLTLKCNVTTVRGITSRMDMMWSHDGLELNTTQGVNVSSIIHSSVLYTNSYTIAQLSTADEGRTYECRAVIAALSPVMATGTVALNVTSMYVL